MRGLARGLDAAALALALLALAVLAAGRVRLGGAALERAEDLVVVLALVVGARLALSPVALPRVSPRAAVAAGIAVYAVVMSVIVVTRHVALRTHALDLGYYVQLVWSLAHGHGAWVTLPPMHAWGDHFSPVLYLFVPLGWLAPGAVALLVAQTLIFAAGAAAVAAFATRRLADPRLGVAFAVLYLLSPTLHGINIRDIHPTAFAIPLLVAAAWAVDAGRPAWAAVAVVLALGGREDAAVAGVGFGVWLALARRRWAAGAAVAAACVALLWFDMNVVMPYFRGEPYPHLAQRYAYLGDSLPEVVWSLVARPWRWVPIVFTLEKLRYVLALLAPLGFLPLLAPRAAAAALPGLAINLLSTDPVLFHHRTPYQAFVLPFLVLAAVEGYTRLRDAAWWPRRVPVRAVLVAAGLVAVVLGARTVNDLGVGKWRLGPEQRAIRSMLARVPPGVPVSVNERLVPHLATRPECYIGPQGLGRAQWVLDVESSIPREKVTAFEVVASERGWTLLRRR
ncbi:MAG TPA: DUF2079 domain-containing protein [Methylomirabilota bacterium]|nr:DUF2079 domain-containing protein [Methylomirabilota bacterium]